VLDLSNNALDDEAAESIARIIRRDQQLCEINLSRNPLRARGLEDIAQAMRNNISLRKVPVDHHDKEALMVQAKRIDDECARNERIGKLLSNWEKPKLEGVANDVPTDVVHLLGQALIVWDQKLGPSAVSVEATRLRHAMLLLSLEKLVVAQPWEQ